MQALYDVPAPAKLNLFLHITGRRPDGYHLLQSVFMLIDWCDTLHFDLRQDGGVTREDLTQPLPPDDLVLRAARALQAATGNRKEALAILERAFKRQQDVEIAAHLGEVLWSLGQRERALAIWREGLRINQDNSTLKDTLKRLGAQP